MRKAMVLLGTAATLLLAGCGGFSCDDEGKCPNDTGTFGSEVSNCQALLDGACGDDWNNYLTCAEGAETCAASGDGVFDENKCSTESAVLTNCCQHNRAACELE